jgi:hypothetical protein
MSRALLVLVLVVAACARAPLIAPTPRPHVYLVIVDGLDARFATAERMPRLFALLATEPARSSFFPSARAVMPTRTNPNHVTLLTGVYPEAHGITGNAYWSRRPGAPPEKLEAASLIEVETLFTVAETTEPALVTMAAFGKPKLARLFAGVRGRQEGPDVLWSPEQLPASRRDPTTGYGPDAETMRALLDATAEREPNLAVVNLSDVDRNGHGSGPESAEYTAAVTGADAAIGLLADDLHARGRWTRSVLIVTADHGMNAVRQVVSMGPLLRNAGVSGVTLVADGGVEHVYVEGLDPARPILRAGTGAATTRERVRAIATSTPGVTEALLRDDVHADWHLDDPRAGELLLVAALGVEFVDPPDPVEAALRGNHGGPDERAVPLVVTGGLPDLHAVASEKEGPPLVDVAPTIAALLGLPRPRHVDGRPVPDQQSGHPLPILDTSRHPGSPAPAP